jgi:hypothetical protein
LQAYAILPRRLRVLGHALGPLEAAAAIALLGGAPWQVRGWPPACCCCTPRAMALNLLRGRVLDCGCGGAPQPLSWGLVVRNLAMVLMATGRRAAPRRARTDTG